MTPEQQKFMELSLETSKNTLAALRLANEQGAIADTIWLSKYETLFDYIESQIDAMQRILAKPKEPEQEPAAVKHMMEWVDYLKRKSDYGQHLQIPSEMSAGACWDLARELEQFINTTPPHRTWVGLTDEEIETLIHRFDSDPHTLLDEVNARLKGKNNG